MMMTFVLQWLLQLQVLKNKWDPYPYKPYVFVVENIIDGWLEQGSIDTSDYGPMYELRPVISLKSCI